MTDDPRKVRLTAKSNQAWDDLEALLKEHVPAELHGAAYQRMDEMHGACYSLAFEDLRILYRALLALLPDHQPEVRAAYQATVFRLDRNDEEDWQRFERERDYQWPQP